MGNLSNVVGQEALRQELRLQIEDAGRRAALLPHILLCGAPSRGKATLASAIAGELQRPYHAVDARSIGKASDLATILTNLEEFGILGILDIDALTGLVIDAFVPAVENCQLKLIIGQGPSAREILLELVRFTLIGTTSKPSRVDERLTRWMTSYDLAPYSDQEMQNIVTRLATDLKLTLDPEAAQLLVRHSEGSPESASVLLRKLVNHDYHIQGYVSLDSATVALRLLGYQQHPTNSRDVLKRVRAMSGAEFERFVANVFQRQGYTAELTSASGDHGIDIILRKLGQVVAVQCKQWESVVGEPILRDFYGAIVNAGVNTGFVVTSSNFTAQAEEFAQNKPIILYDIDSLIQLYLDTLSYSSSEMTT
jgi:Holliday junction resolvasome RuvABC ATP-dependent DNA helicase subunit